MPLIKTFFKSRVVHIGHLNQSADELKPSRDGFGIAVSESPEAWRAITRANAPDVVLHNPRAMWLDALSYSGACMDEITAWMRARRYILPVPVWHAQWIDEASGDFRDGTWATREEAAKAAGLTLEQELAAAARGEGVTMEGDGYRLTPMALKRLGRWHDPLDWFNAAIMLHTREVVMLKQPLVCGVWWDEVEDIPGKVAPGGVLFPEALRHFEVETEDGDVIPFAEAFPQFTVLGAAAPELAWA